MCKIQARNTVSCYISSKPRPESVHLRLVSPLGRLKMHCLYVAGTITKCPLKRDVCLWEVKNVKFVCGWEGYTKCPFNRGVHKYGRSKMQCLYVARTIILFIKCQLMGGVHKQRLDCSQNLGASKSTLYIQFEFFATRKCMNHRQVADCSKFARLWNIFFFFCISVDGHDSHEDAAACLELMRWKVKEDMKKTTRHRPPRHSL